jgi:AcrR family transcriptional regulator
VSGRPLDLDRHNERRDQIMRTAAELFIENGYDSTSVKMMSDKLNMNVAGIYYYFKNKETLLFEFLEQQILTLLERTRKAVEEAGDKPRDRLRSFVREHTLVQTEIIASSSAYSMKTLALGQTTRAYLKRLNALEHDNLDDLRRILEQGQRAGEFDVADVTATAFAILGIVEHVNHWFRPGQRLSAIEIAEMNARFALRLVGAADA